MSCGKDAEHCASTSGGYGSPEVTATWAAGRGSTGHCDKCGGFLTDEGTCNNPKCGTFAMASPGVVSTAPPSGSATILHTASSFEKGICPTCGAELTVESGQDGWCIECEDMVTAIEYTPLSPSFDSSKPGVTPTIADYAATARVLQDAVSGKDRNLTQDKIKAVGYNKVKLALRSVGVPGVDPKKEAVICNMVWQYLDRCPHCKAWISPKTGVCKNPRCKACNTKVGEVRGWNPQRVRWVNHSSQVGRVLHPVSKATKSKKKTYNGSQKLDTKKRD